MNTRRAVIFDLDDTLYAESQFVESGFRAVAVWAADKWDVAVDATCNELDDLRSSAQGRVFDTWLTQHGFGEDHAKTMLGVYREHTPTITAFPNVRPTIASLKGTYQIGLISDGYLTTQQNKFKALELHDLFDAVVFSDAYGRDSWKPSRVPYDAASERLSVANCDCIYVADNATKDFYGARNAGMKSIHLRLENGLYAHVSAQKEEYAADKEIDSWRFVADTVAALFDY